MHGHQRRRARRVDRHRRPLKTERVGDPPGCDTRRAARQQVPAQVGLGLQRARGVVLRDGAHEDTRTGSAQRCRADPGALDRLPGDLQQQALLRVHRQRLTGRDLEELGVERGRAVQEATAADVGLAGLLGVRVVEPLDVPAAVGRERGHGVRAGGDQIPQVLGGFDPAGEAAAHRDDRDRLLLARLDVLQTLACLTKVGGDQLEVVPQLLFVARHVKCRFPRGTPEGPETHESEDSGKAQLFVDQVEHLVVRGRVEPGVLHRCLGSTPPGQQFAQPGGDPAVHVAVRARGPVGARTRAHALAGGRRQRLLQLVDLREQSGGGVDLLRHALREQVTGQGRGRRVAEDQSGLQPQAGRRVEPVPQLHGRERVEAQRLEGPLGLDAVRV